MKLNIEVDISDIAQYLGEGVDLNEEIKAAIISQVVGKVMYGISLGDVQRKAETEYNRLVQDRVQKLAEGSGWMMDHYTEAAITQRLFPMWKDKLVQGIVKELRNDPTFIKDILSSILKQDNGQ